MKILKKIGLVILAIIVLILFVALFIPRDFIFEKSVIINAPIEQVWQHTGTITAQDAWSPWMAYDPNMKIERTGKDGTVGAMSSWESDHEKVGKGSQTITKIEAPNLIETELKFYTPYESEAKGHIKLDSEGATTKVTWGFSGEMPYPFNIMKLTMNMDKAVGEDFDLGLANLKKMCEN